MEKFKEIIQSKAAKVTGISLLTVFLLSLIFCFKFYVVQINKVKGYYCVYKGDKAYKKQDLQKAVYYYKKGIDLHPGHYKALYNLANIYVVYEDYYEALKKYERALEIKPDYEVARIDYAIILSETHKPDEAIDEYQKVVNRKPRFFKIPLIFDREKTYNYNRGVAYYNMGIAYRSKSLLAGLNPETRREFLYKAQESYKNAVKIINSYNTNYNLALIHQLMKDTNQAGYYYCRAIQIAPMEYEAHFNYAVLLKDMKEWAAAAEEFQKAGLILDSKAENDKTKYIYDVLNEVNQKIAMNATNDYFKKLNEEIEKNDKSKYRAGKLIIDMEDDDSLTEVFKTCALQERFMTGENK